jgi:DUF2934 family protein
VLAVANEAAKSANPKSSKGATNVVPPTISDGGAQSTESVGSKHKALLKNSAMPVGADVRRLMIAEAAYYIAERRDFAAGNDVEDWLLAEAQIDATLSAESVPAHAA